MSLPPLTDRRAIRLALYLAIDYEEALLDAYRGVSDSAPIKADTKRRIAAFKRVLNNYFSGYKPRSLGNVKSVRLIDVLGMPSREFSAKV